MTLEEAIIHCREKSMGDCPCADDHRQLAEWLEELQAYRDKGVNENMGDTIYRKAAIDALGEKPLWIEGEYEQGLQNQWEWDVDAIKALPSAQPVRKKGKWIHNSPVTMKCDQCGLIIKDWDWHRFKFCPNCDCDMRGKQDE